MAAEEEVGMSDPGDHCSCGMCLSECVSCPEQAVRFDEFDEGRCQSCWDAYEQRQWERAAEDQDRAYLAGEWGWPR